MLKSTTTVLSGLRSYTLKYWADEVCGTTNRWPHRIALGAVTGADDWGTASQTIRDWSTWADAHGVRLAQQPKILHGTRQLIPTHLPLTTLADTLPLLPRADRGIIARGIRRRPLLPTYAPLTPATLKAVSVLSERDFTLVLRSAEWAHDNDTNGLTPRQVPIPGTHAKWLQKHSNLVATLAGKDTLGLTNRHQRHTLFRYLDPTHLANGGRQFDIHTEGDPTAPAYQPHCVIICENRDSARALPPLQNAIAVEGGGYAAAATLPNIPWIAHAQHVLYWGDIDTAGFEIVSRIRTSGLPVTTILMDPETYATYSQFGSPTDKRGKAFKPHTPDSDVQLHPQELEVYMNLCDPAWKGPRRIEQERIPIPRATQAIVDATTPASAAAA